MGIELKTKTGNITLTAPKVVSGGSVDLSNYYTKPETDAKIQEVVDAIPEVDLSDYATVDYVDSTVDKLADFDYVNDKVREYQGVTEKWADEKFATKTDIPDTSLFVTGEYVQVAINESMPSLSVYAKKSDIPDVSGFITEVPAEYITETELEAKGYLTEHQDISAFQTAEQVNTLIDNALAEIGVAEEGEY